MFELFFVFFLHKLLLSNEELNGKIHNRRFDSWINQ